MVRMLQLETIGPQETQEPGPGPRLTNGAAAGGNEAGQQVVALFSGCDIRH